MNKVAEIEALRERIRDLEGTLKLVDPLTAQYKLPPSLRRILGLLVALSYVTHEMLEQQLGLAASGRVAIYRLRRRLKPYGIEIKSRQSVGYWLEPAMKEKIRGVTSKSNPHTELSTDSARGQ